MPSVPRLTNRQVGPAVVRQPQESVASQPGMGIAAGLGEAAQRIQKVADEARVRGQNVRLNAAEVKVRELRNRILNDRDKGILNRRNENALKAPEDAEREWMQGLSAIRAELGDPEVAEAFQARADQLGVELRDVVNRHVTREIDALETVSKDGILQDTLRSVQTDPSNAAVVAVEMARAEETLRGFLRDRGMPTDVQDRDVAQLRETYRLAQVETLASRNPEQATAVLDGAIERGEIRGENIEKARKFVEAANLTTRAQRVSDDLVSAFANDEAAAIREAERNYEGEERDAIVRRVEIAFARERRLKQEEIGTYTDVAMTAAYEGRPVPRETQVWLRANGQGKVLAAAERVQQAAAEGEPVQTNIATYSELRNLLLPENRAKFLETNLLAYADRISRTDLTEFIDAQVALRGGTTRPSAGTATSTVLTELFQQAQGSAMFGESVKKFGDIELFPEDKEIFNVLRGAVQTDLQALRESQKAEPSTTQVRETIRKTLDGYIIEQRGRVPGFRSRVAVPIGDATPEAMARAVMQEMGVPITPAKVAAIAALADRTDLTPAQKQAEAERIARGQ